MLAHGLHLPPRHSPPAVGPCCAGSKARAAHRVFFKISLFSLSSLWAVTYIYIAKISLFYIPILSTMAYNMSIFTPYSLCVGPGLGLPNVPVGGGRHGPKFCAVGRPVGPQAFWPSILPPSLKGYILLVVMIWYTYMLNFRR